MSIFITLVIAIATIVLSEKIFGKWYNHVSIYTFSWAIFIILYEFKLMNFVDVSFLTWMVIVVAFFFFILGVLTIYIARSTIGRNNKLFDDSKTFRNSYALDMEKLKIFIIVFSLLGLVGAIYNWVSLTHKFGSVSAVLIRANLIYRLRVQGEITEAIPYVFILSHCGIILAGIYSAYKNKFTFIVLLPFIAVIIREIASMGRSGIFLGFLEFISSFYLYKHFLGINGANIVLSRKKLIVGSLIFVSLFVGSMTIIKIFRAPLESYKASSQTLNKVEGGAVISPSVYLYFSSNIGVLSKYLYCGGEHPNFGENTFLPIYDFLSKFNVVDKPNSYPKGYYIPMWTNAGTYLRDLHADFGFSGIIFIPYLLGCFTTFYWFRFFEKGKYFDFIILVYLFIIISFSTFYMVTRAAYFVLSFLILLIISPYLDAKRTNKLIPDM